MRQTAPGLRLTNAELFELGVAYGTQSAIARGRIALLVRLDEPADAEFFESVARGQGTNVRAFMEFEPATAWLVMRTAPV